MKKMKKALKIIIKIIETTILGLAIMFLLVLITTTAVAMFSLGISLMLISILMQRNMLLLISVGTVLIYMSFLYCKGLFEGFEEIVKQNRDKKTLKKDNTRCNESKEYRISQDEIKELNRQYVLYKKNSRPGMKCHEEELCYQIRKVSKMHENMQILICNIDSKYKKDIKEMMYKSEKRLIQNIIDCFRYMNYKNIDDSTIKQPVEQIIKFNENLIIKEQNFFNKYFSLTTQKIIEEKKKEMEMLEFEMEVIDRLINNMSMIIY